MGMQMQPMQELPTKQHQGSALSSNNGKNVSFSLFTTLRYFRELSLVAHEPYFLASNLNAMHSSSLVVFIFGPCYVIFLGLFFFLVLFLVFAFVFAFFPISHVCRGDRDIHSYREFILSLMSSLGRLGWFKGGDK